MGSPYSIANKTPREHNAKFFSNLPFSLTYFLKNYIFLIFISLNSIVYYWSKILFLSVNPHQRSPVHIDLFYWSVSHVGAKPPVSGVIVIPGATEIPVILTVVTKVVFTSDRSSVRFEGTASGRAVDVENVTVRPLPELCCCAAPCYMSTNIHVIHWKTPAATIKCHDVKVAELASEVITVHVKGTEMFHHVPVKVAGCSPVCGSAAEAFHSSQSLAVNVPVWGVVVDWCILHKSLASKLRQILIFSGPGHE